MVSVVTGYLYPWDVLGDPAAVARLRNLGVRRVALAIVYHAVRAVTPRHPLHRQVTLPRTTVLLPASASYPAGLEPDHAPQHDWRVAADLLRGAGIEVCAWVVLTHVDGFDARPDSHRVDAFGDVLDYALCPASPRARAYIDAVLAEVTVATDSAPLILESVTALGWRHQGPHDKAAERLTRVQSDLPSLCFCDTCTSLLTARGVDVADVRSRIRAAGDPVDVAEVTGHHTAVLRAAHRDAAAEAIAYAVAAAQAAPVTLHATAGVDWYTGPSAPVDTGAALEGVSLIASAWDGADAAVGRMRGLRAQHPHNLIGAYLPLLGRGTTDVLAQIDQLLEGGMQELHLYHLGLMNARESAGAAAAIAAVDGFVTKGTDAE